MIHLLSLFALLLVSAFECRLNRRFWRFKKAVQVAQNGGGGCGWGGEVTFFLTGYVT